MSSATKEAFVGRPLSGLPTPAFVVDLKAVEGNCDRMLSRAKEFGLSLRGPTKTHKTVEGGVLQTGGTKRYLKKKVSFFFAREHSLFSVAL